MVVVSVVLGCSMVLNLVLFRLWFRHRRALFDVLNFCLFRPGSSDVSDFTVDRAAKVLGFSEGES